MTKVEIKVGDKFNSLTVIDLKASKKYSCLCKCTCGVIKEINKYHLINGESKTCGSSKNHLTFKKKNKYEIIDNEIKIFSRTKHAFFVIDKKSEWILEDYIWSCGQKNVNVEGKMRDPLKSQKRIRLASLLLKKELEKIENRNKIISFINGNTNDFRLCNLKIESRVKAINNRKREEDNGIFYIEKEHCFQVSLCYNYKVFLVSNISTKEKAKEIRDRIVIAKGLYKHYKDYEIDRPDYFSKIFEKNS